MLSRILRVFLLYAVHFIYILYENLQYLKKITKEIIRRHLHNIRKENDLSNIEQYVSRLKKIPSHVSVIISGETMSYDGFANLVIWSLMSGVSFISFYDKNGTLVKNEDHLFKEVEKKKQGIPGYIKWKHYSDINGYANGTKHKISVLLFSESDGREKIVNYVRDICNDVNNEKLNLSDVNVEHVNYGLKLKYPLMPDPEVIIYFGQTCCSNGFLPWQIRLSEFYGLSSLCKLSLNHFIEILQKYSSCHQRYGV